MKQIRTQDAVGHVLCHDLTQIIKDEFKGVRFRKGHVVTQEDIPVLLTMGKEHLYVWEKTEGILHENDAAERLSHLCVNDNMSCGETKEGKVKITADIDGLYLVDTEKLNQINSIDEIIIASRHGKTAVKKGDNLCATRVIPIVIEEVKIQQAEQIAEGMRIMSLLPYQLKNAGIITSGSEVYYERIKDTFTPVVEEKLCAFGIKMTEHITVDDDTEHLADAIAEMRNKSVDFILCTGGMSVDPDDNTPGAIKRSGAKIITYGAPVLPGAMFLLGYFDDGTPIVGLPGCVMYAASTIFDLVLPLLAAGVRLNKQDFVAFGEGGLCLECEICRYPICPFGK